MNKVKYQIFISSTYDDLKEERDQVIKACLEMGHIPVGMEMFSAADEEQWQIITRQIDESDYYVIIVANRYGSMVDGVSYTEKEYDYAVSKGVPTLGFVLDSKSPWPSDRQEKEKKARSKLEAFKKKVEAKPVNFWNSKEDLHGKCAIALGKTFNTQPRPGWVRSSEEIGPEIAKEISHLSNENRELRDQNDKLQKLTQLTSYENIYSILSNNAVRLSELPESISEVLSKISYELGNPNINSIYMFWFSSIRLREGIVINDSL